MSRQRGSKPSYALSLLDKSFVRIFLDPSLQEECSPHRMDGRRVAFQMPNRMGLPSEIIELSVAKSLQIEAVVGHALHIWRSLTCRLSMLTYASGQKLQLNTQYKEIKV